MAVGVPYNLFICDKDYTKLTKVKYTFLQYSQVLSAIPQAYFVVQNQSPELQNINFRYFEEAYTCIIERDGTEVFRGEMDLLTTPGKDTPLGVEQSEAYGSLDRIGFNASSVVQRLEDLIVIPDSSNTTYGRSFNTVALGTIFSTLITEAAAAPSPVSTLTVGTTENPLDGSGNTITLTSDQVLYALNYLDWIRIIADLGNADWFIENGTQMNFLIKKGTDRTQTVKFTFRKGFQGNNLTGITLNVDRQGMVNRVIVIGAQDGINQITREQLDTQSQNRFGRRERVLPIRALDTTTTAQTYADNFIKKNKLAVPVGSFSIYPVQTHVPFQDFALGDTISVDVDFGLVSFTSEARVMGAVITVEQNGVERIYYDLEEPT